MAGNTSLASARVKDKDEFYTQLKDIEDELCLYKEHFDGKTVYLNCDNPYESEFFRYFVLHFNELGLKKLISTNYVSQMKLPLFEDFEMDNNPYKMVVADVGDRVFDKDTELSEIVGYLKGINGNSLSVLDGDGDFRSGECLEILDDSDVIVTNPPFSLFIEYFRTLMEHGKKFVIIGSQNDIVCKSVFPYLKDSRVWLGQNFGSMSFRVPDSYESGNTPYKIDEQGRKFLSFGNICWFTNLEIKKHGKDLKLRERYDSSKYRSYDNYDAIEVTKVSKIPKDYTGVMGVPATFMDKYDPEQFEIVGVTKAWNGLTTKTYPKQIQITAADERKIVTKLNDNPAIRVGSLRDIPDDKTYYIVDGEYYIATFGKILIRNRHPQTTA